MQSTAGRRYAFPNHNFQHSYSRLRSKVFSGQNFLSSSGQLDADGTRNSVLSLQRTERMFNRRSRGGYESMQRMMSQPPLLAIVVAALVVTQPVSASAQFSIIDLGTLGGTYSAGQAINNRGQVVGEGYTT